jgi:hypothetical protein
MIRNANGNGQIDSGITLGAISSTSAAFLVKYNSSGIAQWATYLEGVNSDIGYGVATDKNNNVYITGHSITVLTEVTIKNANGNGQTNSGIAIKGMRAGGAAFLVKYNSSGIAQWATYFNANTAISFCIATDKNNNVYIGGTYGSYGTIKNANGTGQIDSEIILTPNGGSTAFLIKYNSSGIAQWATYLDGTSGGNNDTCFGIALDSSENVYITGVYNSFLETKLKNAYGTGQRDSNVTLAGNGSNTAAFLIKYSQS